MTKGGGSVQVRRGDIVIVDLRPTEGSEQKGHDRPCVVIQNDVGNKHSPTTIIAPCTTRYDSSELYPFEVEVSSSNTALDEDSVADLSQIRVIDTDTRIERKIGSVPSLKMSEIDIAIAESLGLE